MDCWAAPAVEVISLPEEEALWASEEYSKHFLGSPLRGYLLATQAVHRCMHRTVIGIGCILESH